MFKYAIFLALFSSAALGRPQNNYRAQPQYQQQQQQQYQPQQQQQQQQRQTYAPTQSNGNSDRNAQILRYDNVNNGDGTYNYNYETSNGISAQEQGYLKNPGTNNEIQAVQGQYSYYDPSGQLIKVTYTADENGFQPTGDHLPTPPPIPEAIQRALSIIYANAEKQKQAANNNNNSAYRG